MAGSALRPPPRSSVVDAAPRILARIGVSDMARTRSSRAMLSMPLAHPSALDRRTALGSCIVLRGGVLEPGALVSSKNGMLTPEAFPALHVSCRSTEGPFSLGRGLMLVVSFFKLGIILSYGRDSSPETTKATPWGRLASSCYAARFLANAPLGEGRGEVLAATAIGGEMPARHRDGVGRFGALRDIGGSQHGHGCTSDMRVDQSSDACKSSQ